MADYIDRQRLIDDFHTAGSCFVYGDYIPAIVSRIKIQPAIDLETLLLGRCKNCANWRGNPCDEYAPCKDCDGVMEADNFCRNFEPREDNGNG